MRVSPNIFNVCFSLSHESRGYVECLFCGLFVAYLPLLLHTHTRKLYIHTHTHTYNYIHTHTPYTGSSLSPSLLCYIRPAGPSQVRLPTKKTNRISQEDIPLQIFRHCEWTRHIFLTNCASQCAANVSSLLCVFCVSAGADK